MLGFRSCQERLVACRSAEIPLRTTVLGEARCVSPPRPSYAFLLSHMEHREGFPTPIGVLRAWDALPRYEDLIHEQLNEVHVKRGSGNLAKLLRAGDTWRVEAR